MPTGFRAFSPSIKKAVWVALIIVLAMSAETALASPNPSAEHCSRLGYTSSGEDCVFPDGSRCKQWAFYRGECGARWSFCEQRGGRLESREEDRGEYIARYAVCVFTDGSECGEQAYANNTCGPSQCFAWDSEGCSSHSRETRSEGPVSVHTRHLCSQLKRGDSSLSPQVLNPGDELIIDVCKADWLQCDWDDQAMVSDRNVLLQSKHKNLQKSKLLLRPHPGERFTFNLLSRGRARVEFQCRGNDGETKRTVATTVIVDPPAAPKTSSDPVTSQPSFVGITCGTLEGGGEQIKAIRQEPHDKFSTALCARELCDWIDQVEVSDSNVVVQHEHRHVERPEFQSDSVEWYWFDVLAEGYAELTFRCIRNDGRTHSTYRLGVHVGGWHERGTDPPRRQDLEP